MNLSNKQKLYIHSSLALLNAAGLVYHMVEFDPTDATIHATFAIIMAYLATGNYLILSARRARKVEREYWADE